MSKYEGTIHTPDTMKPRLREMGILPFSMGFETDTYEQAVALAEQKVKEMNQPLSLTCMGVTNTYYPQGLKDLGY